MPWITPSTVIAGQLMTAAFWNTQVRDDLNYLFTNIVPAGTIMEFAAAAAPTGWLLCDGAAVSRTTYAALFSAIGTTWGVGDGSTTFNVPDHRGRTAIGQGTGTGLTARTLASTLGEETHALTLAETPAHHHTLRYAQAAATGSCPPNCGELIADATGGTFSFNSADAGGGGAHNNMPPSLVVAFIIKT